MSEIPDPWDVPGILQAVRLTDDPALASELSARLPLPSEPRTISVGDLLAPRRAFWRRVHGPAPVPLDRELQLVRGRAWHRWLGDAIASEGRLEVRFRRGGLSGRIDLLSEVPVEIKTGAAPPEGRAPEDWPEQVEQLAIYCAVAGSRVGRLAHLALSDDRPPAISVGELEFRDLEGVSAEVLARERTLRSALDGGRPDRLARCHWFSLGCEFRAAGVCDCRGDEGGERTSIVEHLSRRTPRPEIASRWAGALGPTAGPADRSLGHFRDLLYPRRAYFDRAAGRPAIAPPMRPVSGPGDAYDRAVGALEHGTIGEVHRLSVRREGPEEDVLAWRGSPCLVRSSRVRYRLTADDVQGRFPQYLLDLGFRCAVTGTERATLVVAYDPPLPGELPLQVFRVELTGGTGVFASAWRSRRATFDRALTEAAPGSLPGCPGWMTASCPYRDVCGCPDEPGRSQR